MPHRPEDTSNDKAERERPGETPSQSIEGFREGPRPESDTQPPAPTARKSPGKYPSHGERR